MTIENDFTRVFGAIKELEARVAQLELGQVDTRPVPEPPAFKVGDRVHTRVHTAWLPHNMGTVRGVDGDNVWVKFDSAANNTTYLSKEIFLVKEISQ